jgi:hypothetical protein
MNERHCDIASFVETAQGCLYVLLIREAEKRRLEQQSVCVRKEFVYAKIRLQIENWVLICASCICENP